MIILIFFYFSAFFTFFSKTRNQVSWNLIELWNVPGDNCASWQHSLSLISTPDYERLCPSVNPLVCWSVCPSQWKSGKTRGLDACVWRLRLGCGWGLDAPVHLSATLVFSLSIYDFFPTAISRLYWYYIIFHFYFHKFFYFDPCWHTKSCLQMLAVICVPDGLIWKWHLKSS